MAVNAFYTTPDGSAAAFTSADGTAAKVVHQFSAAGGRAFSIFAVNETGSAQTVRVFRRKAGVNSILGELVLPIGAGLGNSAPVELLDPRKLPAMANVAALQDGVPFGPNQEIWAAMGAAITSGSVTVQVIPGAG
jgi:hypothetical protein